ncbi:MAG: glutathione synthase [Proteobacteria bacterium]|nr:glutathione synthase [Pseudomonadota bacterium]MDA0862211.1 glutathione synthase [Pseudomonadota bacterium]MDA1030251.1 glutathione synthase [Pseudomonadota bacterium]
MNLLFILDPLETLNIEKDTSFVMMREAQHRGHKVWAATPKDLKFLNNKVIVSAEQLKLNEESKVWYVVIESKDLSSSSLDGIIMRKDPPFDMEYVYSTYLLEAMENEGCRVFNRPQSIRDFNEKLAITKYPQFIAPTLVTADIATIKPFIQEHNEVVLKPLDGMGGSSVFRSRPDDPNLGVILETLSELGNRTIMIQKFIPQISAGDKRVLVIDGEPVPYSLARIPQGSDHRGNLAAGGRGEAMALTDREREISNALGQELSAKGLLLVGLDIIGDYLTEINVTSPTCMREIQDQTGFDVPKMFIDSIEKHIVEKK